MRLTTTRSLTVLVLLATLGVPTSLVQAKVAISVNGISQGSLIYTYKGPSGINKRISLLERVGSIKRAWTRALFTKRQVFIGNEVTSTGTTGDQSSTHVRAGSLFYGSAKFEAAKKGQTVRNFKIQYHVDGDLNCSVTDPTVPKDYSKAMMETQVRFNGVDRFAGSGTVDGVVGFDGGTGHLAGKFTQKSKKSVSINRDFNLNLGTLTDGKKYPMLFFGATLVSYGPDIPVKSCSADFYDTSTFSVTEAQGKRGKFTLTPARTVATLASPQPWSLMKIADARMYLEDKDTGFLNAVDVNTVQLFDRLGDRGNLQPKAVEDVGDSDSDGIPDRAFVFDGISLLQLFDLASLGLVETAKLFIVGDTTAGVPFMGTVAFAMTKA